MNFLDKLYKPDKKGALNTSIIGRPGSGKTVFIRETLRLFLRQNDDPNYRAVIYCPKNEFYLDNKKENQPIQIDKLESHLRKNRVAIIYGNSSYLEAEADYIIETLFNMQSNNPDVTSTFICDDSQIFISSRSTISNSFKRIVLTGRSKGIRFVPVSHSLIYNKDVEGSTSYIVLFNLPFVAYHNDAKKRYGFDPSLYQDQLASVPYSYIFFDVQSTKVALHKPIELK